MTYIYKLIQEFDKHGLMLTQLNFYWKDPVCLSPSQSGSSVSLSKKQFLAVYLQYRIVTKYLKTNRHLST